MDNSYLKSRARLSLKGNWSSSMIVTFVYMFVAGILGGLQSVALSNLVGIFVLSVFGYGLNITYLRTKRQEIKFNIENCFDGFKTYGRVLGITLLVAIYTLLWLLLLVIPGIIKSLSYALTIYIAHDNPELSCDECINRSIKMMNGHKMDLFLLILSFIGWFLLGIVTLGLAFIAILPYYQMTIAHFYDEVKKEYETVE